MHRRTLLLYHSCKSDYSYTAHPDTKSIADFCFSKECKLHTLNLPDSCPVITLEGNVYIVFYKDERLSRNTACVSEEQPRRKKSPIAIDDNFTNVMPDAKSLKVKNPEPPAKIQAPRKKDNKPVKANGKNSSRVYTINDPEMNYPFVLFGGYIGDLYHLCKKERKLHIPGCCIITCFVTKHTVYISRDLVSEKVIESIQSLAKNEQINSLISSTIRGVDDKDSHNPKAKKKNGNGKGFKGGRSTFEPLKGRRSPTGVISSVKCPGARNPVKLWH